MRLNYGFPTEPSGMTKYFKHMLNSYLSCYYFVEQKETTV